jgi:protein phosphatase
MMEISLRQPYSFYQLGRRGNQEDARFPDDDAPQDCNPAFIVCDGVGGQDKGEVASRTVADAIGKYMTKIDLSLPFTAHDFQKVLDHAYSALNKKIETVSHEMATTLTFVCFNSNGAFCAHMGDSRIYHIRPGVGILYQSEDHSLVNMLVHSGNLTPEKAINHPQSNVITRCMGYVEKGTSRPTAPTACCTK